MSGPGNNPWFANIFTRAAVDAGCALANGGFLDIYNGTQPTDAETAITTQTKLAHLALSATAFGASTVLGAAGSRVATATANTITDDTSADATGTATWFRVTKSTGVAVFDGSVGAVGDTADLILATTSIVAGQDVAVSSFTVKMLD
jgi:hypothetical protein